MRLSTLESHYFSTSNLRIEEEDATPFIMQFMKEKFLPQVFTEQLPDLSTKQQFFFTNQNTNQNIMFHDNKISFIQNFNDNSKISATNIEHFHTKFIAFIENMLSNHELVRSNIKFNRVSYVIKFYDTESFDKEKKGLMDSFTNFPWVKKDKQPAEFQLSYGYKDIIDTEQINVLTKTFLGGIHVISPGGTSTSECFFKEIDINTIDENKINRFDTKESISLMKLMKSTAAEKMSQLSF